MKLEKAVIEVLDGSNSGARYPVLFNPFEYSLERSIGYKATAIPGLGGPLLQFINGDAEVLTMELFVDDYTDAPPDGKSVSDRMDDIAQLLQIDQQLHAPPPVRFVWGKLAFKALLEKLSRKITLFRPDGMPARATLNVSFREYQTLRRVNNPCLELADKTKREWSSAMTAFGRWRGANTEM